MESLSLDRYRMNMADKFPTCGMTLPTFGCLTAPLSSAIPHSSYSYTPMFSYGNLSTGFMLAEPPANPSFDSNLYFGSFGMCPQPMFMPSPAFTTQLLTLPIFEQSQSKLSSLITSIRRKKKAPVADYSNMKYSTAVKYSSLKEAGYNKDLAEKLTKSVLSHVESHSTGNCSKYVSDAMARVGVVGTRGDAWLLRDSLRRNPHFKEVDLNSVDVTKLPAGCILVYQRGAAGYSSDAGHVEITLGNGKAASDFVNDNIRKSSNMNVFVPVKA